MPHESRLKQPIPPKFGVAGLLKEGSPVLFENLFSARHLGHVNDLVVARLRPDASQERGIRALLMLGILEATQRQIPGRPALLECGADAECFAVTVCFEASETEVANPEAVLTEGSTEQAASFLDGVHVAMRSHAHRLFIRVQPETRRFEIGAVILLGGAPVFEVAPGEFKTLEEGPELERVRVPMSAAQAVPPMGYTALGDLDYAKFLVADDPSTQVQPKLVDGKDPSFGSRAGETTGNPEGPEDGEEAWKDPKAGADLDAEKRSWMASMKGKLFKEQNRLEADLKAAMLQIRKLEAESKRKDLDTQKVEDRFRNNMTNLERQLRNKEAVMARMSLAMDQREKQFEKMRRQPAVPAATAAELAALKAVTAEAQDLRAKLQFTQSKLEELKWSGQLLAKRLADAQKAQEEAGPGSAELKKRLDSLTKIANLSKQQGELLNSQVSGLQKEVATLKAENLRLQSENTGLKKGPKGGKGKAA